MMTRNLQLKRQRKRFAQRPRRGFTLTELMVSVAILVGMMAIIATIFNIAGKATGTAQSSTKLQRHILQVAEVMNRDLSKMSSGTGRVFAIAGVQVNTKERTEDLDTNIATHRADMLMLVTPREMTPFVTDVSGSPTISLDSMKHVVYGHARLGKYMGSGTWNNVRAPATLAASEWHLARRVTGFDTSGSSPPGTARWPLTGPEFINEDSDIVDVLDRSFATIMDPGLPSSPLPTGYYVYTSPTSLGFYFLQNGNGTFAYNLLGSSNDYRRLANSYWWEWVGGVPDWGRQAPAGTPFYLTPGLGAGTGPGNPSGPHLITDFNDSPAQLGWYWPEWFYTGPDSRVLLDPNPGVGEEARLAPYFLPACSEFKVEVTFDDPHELAIDASYDVVLATQEDAAAPAVPAPQPIRWQTVPDGQIWVWYDMPDTSSYPDDDSRKLTDPFRWPRAVRITLTAYDPAANLDRPVTYSLVHTFE